MNTKIFELARMGGTAEDLLFVQRITGKMSRRKKRSTKTKNSDVKPQALTRADFLRSLRGARF